MKRTAIIIPDKLSYILIIVLIICIANIFLILSTSAQTFTNNNTGINIENGITVTVQGDVLTTNSGSYNNNGIIELTGNWTNNSSSTVFGTSQGTVVLNGITQNIQGNTNSVFNNLILQGTTQAKLLTNAITGGGNALPSGVLNVGAGTLDLNGFTLTVNNTSTNAITTTTGGIISEMTDNSSKVNWYINNITGAHTIPFITNGGIQIPFTYNLVTGNAGTLTVSTYPTTTSNLPYPQTPIVVTHVRNNFGVDNSMNTADRFWQIDKTGINANATCTFSIANAESPAPGSALIAQHWSPLPEAWDIPLPGQTNPTSLSVTTPGITLNGVYALSLMSSPLPVEFLSFTAKPVNDNYVLSQWIVSMEKDNDHFEVERSRNGVDFEMAGFVASLGNTVGLRSYEYKDINPYQGFSYYRLKQVDINGDYSYSNIVTVLFGSINTMQLSCYPNPGNGLFNLLTTSPVRQLQVINTSGQLIKQWQPTDETYNQKIDLSELPSGIYMLKAFDGFTIKSIKLMIEK